MNNKEFTDNELQYLFQKTLKIEILKELNKRQKEKLKEINFEFITEVIKC